MKGGEAAAKILKMQGVDFITGFPMNPLHDYCAAKGIRIIKFRMERAAINCIYGYTMASFGKRTGVAAVQFGPGIENTFPGVAQAYSDNIPILVLPGGYQRRQQGWAPNLLARDNYKHITKWVDTVNFAERVPEMMRLAFSYLKSGRPGPVVLELPMDVMHEDFDDAMFYYKPVQGYKSQGNPADVEKVVKILLEAKCPVIRAGTGVLFAEAWNELKEFAELTQIPVTTSLSGKSAFPENHYLALGSCSRTRTDMVLKYFEKADVIFAIGSSNMREIYTSHIPDPQNKIIMQSTIDERDINKGYHNEQAIIGDAKLVLRQMIEAARNQIGHKGRPKNEALANNIKELKNAWLKEWEPKLASDQVPINPYRIIGDLMKALDEKETIITHDAGTPRDHMVPFYQSVTPGGYIGWGKSTTMGASLGIAMGAKLAQPGKTCVAFMGDGSFGMVGMDFETAIREKIPIIVIVMNNGTLGMFGGISPIATEKYGLTKVSGNYSMIAEAFGGYSERVEKPKDIIPAIQRAKKANDSGKAALLEIMTQEELAMSNLFRPNKL
jgi:thiamine pyrophosphate-dependent acetolactate synthase large subunit-like protein